MFSIFRREPEKPNYAKIFAITFAAVAAASAVAFMVFKLFNKYCALGSECEGFLEDDGECECDCECCHCDECTDCDTDESVEADAAEDVVADK